MGISNFLPRGAAPLEEPAVLVTWPQQLSVKATGADPSLWPFFPFNSSNCSPGLHMSGALVGVIVRGNFGPLDIDLPVTLATVLHPGPGVSGQQHQDQGEHYRDSSHHY